MHTTTATINTETQGVKVLTENKKNEEEFIKLPEGSKDRCLYCTELATGTINGIPLCGPNDH